MKELCYTLLSDGSSDKALLPILTWLLRENQIQCAIQQQWADLRRLPKPPKKLSQRILISLELYPCNLLFLHRDAENQPRQERVDEIQQAVKEVVKSLEIPPVVCVIPVRMQEAWLLLDEVALRKAAGNPNGSISLAMPNIKRLEQLSDPKNTLHNLLRQASELKGRRLKQFSIHERVHRVAELIDDFSALRVLSAFQALEDELQTIIRQQGWCS